MASSPRAQLEHPAVESGPARERRTGEPAQDIERRVTVPIVDEFEPGRVVYAASMSRLALVGALTGALALGLIAWIIASGIWSLPHVGQFGAAGPGVAAFTGAGIGAATGALAGALAALYRMPARRAPRQPQPQSQ